MLTSTLTDQQFQRYRALRRDGVGAATAYRIAVAAQPAPAYRIGPGDQITFVFDDRPDLAEFTVTATSVPDLDPDLSWLGEFRSSRSRPPEAIELPRSLQRGRHRCYFVPTYSLAQRRADLSARGYARGVAHLLAERGVRDDAHLVLDLDYRIVTVEVRKAGVLLATASMSTDVAPDECPDDALAAVADDCGLIDEAVADARATLPGLLTALAA
ncbi:hypothetical protein [Saccharopolyspora taberi]|uniref:Uncharacterized protein n=1 Tax=Saccharopolyspora taberi TaxID=60895 RepID=A0ABN3V8A1_9PSEU